MHLYILLPTNQYLNLRSNVENNTYTSFSNFILVKFSCTSKDDLKGVIVCRYKLIKTRVYTYFLQLFTVLGQIPTYTFTLMTYLLSNISAKKETPDLASLSKNGEIRNLKKS